MAKKEQGHLIMQSDEVKPERSMNRRQFLKRLAGVAAAATAPVYFFPPRGGWTHLESGVWANNTAGTPLWAAKTSKEIVSEVNAVLETTRTITPDILLVSTFARMSGESDEALKRRFARTLDERFRIIERHVVICSPRLGASRV